ncbi:amidase [Phormidium tenue FACHB-886]|nr:amidase [Phormidium tenue FACHB-886]
MRDLSILEQLSHDLQNRFLSSRELVEHVLENIKTRDRTLNSISAIIPERALAMADRLDRELAEGKIRSPLHGIPFGVKDFLDVEGAVTTAGFPAYARRKGIATQDAELVARLVAAGAIPVAKTSTNELAYGLDGCNVHYGQVYNPWDPARVAGGSSSGSGAAVAANLLPFALGSDTGGSIRVPCAYNGISGIRATHGQVFTGCVPLAPIFDTVGPMARWARDVAIAHAILQQETFPQGTFNLNPEERIRGLVLGVVDDAGLAKLPPETLEIYKNSLRTLEAAGVYLDLIDLPIFAGDEAFQTFTTLQSVQGLYSHLKHFEEDADEMSPTVRSRMERGFQISALDYVRAEQVRQSIVARVKQALEGRAALLLPTTPTPAHYPDIDTFDFKGSLVELRNSILRLCCIGALSGHPIAAVPAGLYQGLPLGWQVVGGKKQDLTVLALADAIQHLITMPFQPAIHTTTGSPSRLISTQ